MDRGESVWERLEGRDARGVFYRYRHVATGFSSNRIPALPSGWTERLGQTNQRSYVNRELGIILNDHPCVYLKNDTLLGCPWFRDWSSTHGFGGYVHGMDDTHVNEPEIKLSNNWQRGVTRNNRRFYFNDEIKEFSYLLPGADDLPLRPEMQRRRTNQELQRTNQMLLDVQDELGITNQKLLNVQDELGSIRYHLHNREVLSRCERVIALSLIKKFRLNINSEQNQGGRYQKKRLDAGSLNQALNLIQRRGFDIDEDLVVRLRDACDYWFHLKTLSHEVVHQQLLTVQQLDDVMEHIFSRVARSTRRAEVDQTIEPYRRCLRWIHEHCKEYLRTGDPARLEGIPLFPLDEIFADDDESIDADEEFFDSK